MLSIVPTQHMQLVSTVMWKSIILPPARWVCRATLLHSFQSRLLSAGDASRWKPQEMRKPTPSQLQRMLTKLMSGNITSCKWQQGKKKNASLWIASLSLQEIWDDSRKMGWKIYVQIDPSLAEVNWCSVRPEMISWGVLSSPPSSRQDMKGWKTFLAQSAQSRQHCDSLASVPAVNPQSSWRGTGRALCDSHPTPPPPPPPCGRRPRETGWLMWSTEVWCSLCQTHTRCCRCKCSSASNIILQACGWPSLNEIKSVSPTPEETFFFYGGQRGQHWQVGAGLLAFPGCAGV